MSDELWLIRSGRRIRELGWVEKQEVERDICLLYHQLAEYSYIMGDLYFGTVFRLPYWEYLAISGELASEDAAFIRDGCLVMILAMAWETIDGAGSYIHDFEDECIAAVASVEAEDQETLHLLKVVATALQIVKQGGNQVAQDSMRQLTEDSGWVHRQYVEGYYTRAVDLFQSR